jgi:WD40 repeat protein
MTCLKKKLILKVNYTLNPYNEDVKYITYLKDDIIALAAKDSTIKLFNITSNELVKTLIEFKHNARCLVYLHDEDLLLSGGDTDKTIIIWNITSGQSIRRIYGHHYGIKSMSYLGNGLLATGDYKGHIFIWNLTIYSKLQEKEVKSKEFKILEGHERSINSLCSLNNDLLASGNYF